MASSRPVAFLGGVQTLLKSLMLVKLVREGERAEKTAAETALRGKFKAASRDDDTLYRLLEPP
jgi:hypothetical protein